MKNYMIHAIKKKGVEIEITTRLLSKSKVKVEKKFHRKYKGYKILSIQIVDKADWL